MSWEHAGVLADGKTSLYLPPCLGRIGERYESLVVLFVRLKSSLQTTLLLSQYLEAHRKFVFKLFGDGCLSSKMGGEGEGRKICLHKR